MSSIINIDKAAHCAQSMCFTHGIVVEQLDVEQHIITAAAVLDLT